MSHALQRAWCWPLAWGRQQNSAVLPLYSRHLASSKYHTEQRNGRRSLRRAGVGGSDGSGSVSGGGGESSGGEGGSEQSLLMKARLLNELFYAESAPDPSKEADSSTAATPDEPPTTSTTPPSPLRLPNLPLWRVQWAALPGHLEVLHVHVPWYTSMFEQLFRGPRPWRFGHVYLPEGSKNLGIPEYALAPGTKAPLAGTLMEVLQVVRFGDGRLLILAVGVGRFRVTKALQETPFCRADVEVMVDVEEQQEFEGLALQALESVRGGLDGRNSVASSGVRACEEVPLATLMSAVPAAAREAAAAWGLAWLDYELSDARQGAHDGPAVIDGSRSGEAQALGRRLAAIAGNEVLVLPFHAALTSAAEAAATAADAEQGAAAAAQGQEASEAAGGIASEEQRGQGPSGSGRSAGKDILPQALADQRLVLRRTEASASTLATSAAASCMAHHIEQWEESPAGSTSGGVAAAAPSPIPVLSAPVLNTASERGTAVQSPEEILGPSECLSGEPDTVSVAIQLEEAVWREIAAVHSLASKLRDREAPLPDGLRCLRPWLPAATSASSSSSSSRSSSSDRVGAAVEEAPWAAGNQPGAHPDYPALRRLQRLSFALAALLANLPASEGRQAWVEAGSICVRLRMGLAALRKHRQVLAAVVAVEGL